MAIVTINETILDDIAEQTRAKNGESDLYKPNQIPAAISRIVTPKLEERILVQNGEYYPHSGKNGISKVTVNVPTGSISVEDEGKVVQNGALVEQTSVDIENNGTYNTVINNEVVVNVPNTYDILDEGKVVNGGALVAQTSKSVTANGTYDTTLNNEVVVNVADLPVAAGVSF